MAKAIALFWRLVAHVQLARRFLKEINPAHRLTRWQQLAFWGAVATLVGAIKSHEVGLGAKIAQGFANRGLCVAEQAYGLPRHTDCPEQQKKDDAAPPAPTKVAVPEPVPPVPEIAPVGAQQAVVIAPKRAPETKRKERRAKSVTPNHYRLSLPPTLRHRGVPVYAEATPFSTFLGWIPPDTARVTATGNRKYFPDPSAGRTAYVEVLFNGGKGWVCEAFLKRVTSPAPEAGRPHERAEVSLLEEKAVPFAEAAPTPAAAGAAVERARSAVT